MTDDGRLVVARLVRWRPRGGNERKLAEILPLLDGPLFRVLLVSTSAARGDVGRLLEECGIPFLREPTRRRLSPLGLWRLSRLLRAERVDIVHSHRHSANTAGTLSARFAGSRWS